MTEVVEFQVRYNSDLATRWLLNLFTLELLVVTHVWQTGFFFRSPKRPKTHTIIRLWSFRTDFADGEWR